MTLQEETNKILRQILEELKRLNGYNLIKMQHTKLKRQMEVYHKMARKLPTRKQFERDPYLRDKYYSPGRSVKTMQRMYKKDHKKK